MNPLRVIASSACILLASPAVTACTTVTTVHAGADASTLEPTPLEPTPGDEDPVDASADAGPDAAATKPDGGKPLPPSDAGPPPIPDGGSVLTGGSITVTCPSTGFHAGPPVKIASIPSAYLPRCTSTTRACYFAAATSAAADTCLAADTTPPATIGGEAVNCRACERSQGSYCLASACTTEFTAYACCAQAQGGGACSGLLNTVTACAGTTGKSKFDTCLSSLVPRCFP